MARWERITYVLLAGFGSAAILFVPTLDESFDPDPLLVLTAVLAWLGLVLTWVAFRYQIARRPRPALELIHEGSEVGGVALEISLPAEDPPDFSEDLEAKRQELLRLIPPSPENQPTQVTQLLRLGGLIAPPSSEDIEQYERNVESYLERYEEFLKESWRYEAFWSHSYLLVLSFANRRAEIPADGVRVILRFPESAGLTVLDPEDAPEKPESPQPPSPPGYKTAFDLINPAWFRTPDLRGLVNRSLGPLTTLDIRPGNVSSPTIRRGSIVVEYRIEELLHNLHDDTRDKPIIVQFDRTGHWQIPFEIHARNLPRPTRGSLRFETFADNEVENPGKENAQE